MTTQLRRVGEAKTRQFYDTSSLFDTRSGFGRSNLQIALTLGRISANSGQNKLHDVVVEDEFL